MPLVKKTLLKTGIYEAPQGTLKADRPRIQRWVDTFKRMRDAGLEIPICWGHQPEATPGDCDDQAKKQYWLGAYNAGYLRDLSLTDAGEFDGKLDCPGVELKDGKLVHWVKLPDGRQVRGAIGEVSIAVRPFRDGKGRDWGESVVHVGLTPLPVAAGTGGFTATLSRAFDARPGEGFTLSLTNMTRTLSAEAPVADDNDDFEGAGEGETPTAKAETPPAAPEPPAPEGSEHFKAALEYLRGHGISMPEDTTEENFLERICVACHALENQAEEVSGQDLDDNGEIGGGEMPTDDAPIEEQRPMMMSLSTVSDPATHAMLSREQDAHRRKLLKQIDGLCARGLKPERAEELRSKAAGYELSLDGEYNPAPKQLDLLLSLLDESLPARHPLKGLQTTGARVAKRPGPEDDTQTRRRQEKVGDELAAMAGARAK